MNLLLASPFGLHCRRGFLFLWAQAVRVCAAQRTLCNVCPVTGSDEGGYWPRSASTGLIILQLVGSTPTRHLHCLLVMTTGRRKWPRPRQAAAEMPAGAAVMRDRQARMRPCSARAAREVTVTTVRLCDCDARSDGALRFNTRGVRGLCAEAGLLRKKGGTES